MGLPPRPGRRGFTTASSFTLFPSQPRYTKYEPVSSKNVNRVITIWSLFGSHSFPKGKPGKWIINSPIRFRGVTQQITNCGVCVIMRLPRNFVTRTRMLKIHIDHIKSFTIVYIWKPCSGNDGRVWQSRCINRLRFCPSRVLYIIRSCEWLLQVQPFNRT